MAESDKWRTTLARCAAALVVSLSLEAAMTPAEASQADSPNFALDTTEAVSGGSVSQGDSANFALDTSSGAIGGGVSEADSANFTLDTTGGGSGAEGVSQGDSVSFTVDTRGAEPGEVSVADSANFTVDTRGPFTLVVSISGSGAVARRPDLASYAPGAAVDLTATPSPDWVFASWSGDASGTGNPLSVTMTNNKTITANFSLPTPATLSAPAYVSGNRFEFSVGGAAGANYVIQTSTNLSTANWLSIFTNAVPFTFTDTGASNYVQRFYRALYLP